MEAQLLLADAHGRALRFLAQRCGFHLQGLGHAARKIPGLPARVRRHLLHLDIANNWARHITAPKVESFLRELELAMAAGFADATGTEATAVPAGDQGTKNCAAHMEYFSGILMHVPMHVQQCEAHVQECIVDDPLMLHRERPIEAPEVQDLCAVAQVSTLSLDCMDNQLFSSETRSIPFVAEVPHVLPQGISVEEPQVCAAEVNRQFSGPGVQPPVPQDLMDLQQHEVHVQGCTVDDPMLLHRERPFEETEAHDVSVVTQVSICMDNQLFTSEAQAISFAAEVPHALPQLMPVEEPQVCVTELSRHVLDPGVRPPVPQDMMEFNVGPRKDDVQARETALHQDSVSKVAEFFVSTAKAKEKANARYS